MKCCLKVTTLLAGDISCATSVLHIFRFASLVRMKWLCFSSERFEGVLVRVCEWDSSVVTVEGSSACVCVLVLGNGIFWILREFQVVGNSLCYVELLKDNSILNVHNKLQMVHHNSTLHLLWKTYITHRHCTKR